MEQKRTKFGSAMYNFTTKFGKFLCKIKPLYYLLNLTWGLFLTIIGWFVALAMLVSKHKPTWYHGIIYFKTTSSNWGGFSIGMVFVVCSNAPESTLEHEYGHTYQNAILGPFMLFLVSIPSMIRYWVRDKEIKKGNALKTDYDAIWFESGASDIGHWALEYEKEEEKDENK